MAVDALAAPHSRGGTLQTLVEALPSAEHKRSFVAAIEVILLGQPGICLTGEAGSGSAAFVDQLATVLPPTQVVVARLGRTGSPEELQAALEAAGAHCPRLAHILLVVSDADTLRRDTLDRLDSIAGDLLVRRQGLQLLLAGHPRLLDRLRVIRHHNLLRYLETRLVLPALDAEADANAPIASATFPAASDGAFQAAARSEPARNAWRRPQWVTGTSVAAASVLLAVGGLTLAIRRTAPERVPLVAAASQLALMDAPRPAIVPNAVMAEAPAAAMDPAGPSAPPPPSQRPPAAAAFTDAAPKLAATPSAPDPATAAVLPTLFAMSDPAPPPALLPAPAAPDPTTPAIDPDALEPDEAPPALASAPATPDPAAPLSASTADAPALARGTLTPGPAAPDAEMASVPAASLAPQMALDLGADAQLAPSRPAGPGLLLVAERGDTLARLYQRIYAGVSPPPFAAVLAVNRATVQPGVRLLFPAPPGGWPSRLRGGPQGGARMP